MRCRARLARPPPRSFASRMPGAPGRMGQVWRSLVAVLGVVYLTEVLIQAIRTNSRPPARYFPPKMAWALALAEFASTRNPLYLSATL
jgi:hypothetical protein